MKRSARRRGLYEGQRHGDAAGGNAVIVHRAIISKPGVWPWYEKLVGRSFKIHPMLQSAVVHTVDASHPATFGLPARWIWSDERYEFTNPHGVTINPILKVDERSYDPTKIWPGQTATGAGRRPPRGLVPHLRERPRFVTALGHNAEMYKDPTYLGLLWVGFIGR